MENAISHSDTTIPVAVPPASTRIVYNPASISTSSMAMRLARKEYAHVVAKYRTSAAEKPTGSVRAATANPSIRGALARGNPQLTGRAPEANGRFRLAGWRRSALMSARSLRTYTPEAQRQKHTKATRAAITSGKWNTLCDVTNGAKTRTFLTHCCGRSAAITDRVGAFLLPSIAAGSANSRTFRRSRPEGATRHAPRASRQIGKSAWL